MEWIFGEKMDLLFLGTSSGTPTKQRNVTALALQPENCKHWYLVDCGEGTQHQLLRTPLSAKTLKAIFITHVHGDHCYGLPGLLASAGMHGRTEPLVLMASRAIADWIKSTQQLTELYLPYELQFVDVEACAVWQDEAVRVDAALLSHRVTSYGYIFKELQTESCLDGDKLKAEGIPQGPVWGQLKKGKDVEYQGKILHGSDYLHYPYSVRKVVVGGDNDQPALLTEACHSAQVLIHEATYTQEIGNKVGASVMHSSAQQVAVFAESVKIPNLILTHFSARYQNEADKSPSMEDIRLEAQQHYQGALWLAEDFARYRLAKTGQLSCIVEP